MLPIRTYLIRYLIPFLLIYLGLLGFSHLPPVREKLKNTARTQTGFVLNQLLPKTIFISDPKRINYDEKPSRITLAYANRGALEEQQKKGGTFSMDFRLLHYELDQAYLMGLFFLISLIAITPISWKRRALSVLLGSILMYALNTIAIYILAIQKIANEKIGVYELSSNQLEYIDLFSQIFNNAIIFVLPVIVWGIVTLRKGDLKKFVLTPTH